MQLSLPSFLNVTPPTPSFLSVGPPVPAFLSVRPSMLDAIHLGNCLEVMKNVPDGSVDMILCDLPYGTTECHWDTVIPFDQLWSHYRRIIKGSGAIVLTGNNAFTGQIICSNPEWFKYSWVWKKPPTDFVRAKLKPMSAHEDVCVFSAGSCAGGAKNNMPYYPQDLVVSGKTKKGGVKSTGSMTVRGPAAEAGEYIQEFTNYPSTIIEFKKDGDKIHPTQKPVALFEYLIKTYTLPGQTVMDNCIGSGTTAIAAINTGRRFIGIEQDPEIHRKAVERVRTHNAPHP